MMIRSRVELNADESGGRGTKSCNDRSIEVFPQRMLKSAGMLGKKRSLGDCSREEAT